MSKFNFLFLFKYSVFRLLAALFQRIQILSLVNKKWTILQKVMHNNNVQLTVKSLFFQIPLKFHYNKIIRIMNTLKFKLTLRQKVVNSMLGNKFIIFTNWDLGLIKSLDKPMQYLWSFSQCII